VSGFLLGIYIVFIIYPFSKSGDSIAPTASASLTCASMLKSSSMRCGKNSEDISER
jgi:hypothetical protein